MCANERTSGVHAARHGPWTGRKGLDRMRYRKFENYCSASRSLSLRASRTCSRTGLPTACLDKDVDWDPR